MPDFDVIIIGGGPGGYVCAIRAAQLGLGVAVIEGRATLGGTCLNVGCIPSKALLHASHQYHAATHDFAAIGIDCGAPTVDLGRMMAYKASIVEANTKGIEFLFKKNKVTRIDGWARIDGPGRVAVGETVHTARHIVIATGSESATLAGVEIDEKTVVSSTGALALDAVPGRLAVIGAGVIGLELGSVYRRLGAEVTVIEYLDQITPGMDGEIAKTLQRSLKKQGLKFVMGAAVEKAETSDGGVRLHYRLRKTEEAATIDADVVLVATGRRSFTEGLGLDAAGVAVNARGQIETTGWKTSAEGIWAIGDVTAGPMLAHKAEEEGIAVAETIAGQHGDVNYEVIPAVIYTDPEVASVGRTESQLKEQGRAYKVGKFNFMGNGRAKASQMGEGFAKILADAETDRILGAHLIGPAAGEMIHEICVAMEFGAAAEDLARTCHAHPTFSEAVREAALACNEGAIHA